MNSDSLHRKLDGLAHKHIIVALKPVEIRGLLFELERVPAVRIQGKAGELTFDPCERNVASARRPRFGGKKKKSGGGPR